MTDTTTASPRERWRAFFLTILAGQDELAQVAADVAIDALRRGASQDAAAEAGMLAARRVVDGAGTTAPRTPRPAAASRPAPSSGRSASQGAGAPAPAAPRDAGPRPAEPRRGAHAPGGWPPGSAVAVYVDRRTESLDGQFFQVLSCRLRELVDGRPAGPVIPVEIRGRSIIGHLVKDDVVILPEGPTGRTRIVKTMHNLTTDSEIQAKGRPFRRWRTLRRTVHLVGAVVGGVVVLAALAALVLVAGSLLGGGGSVSLG